VVPGVTDIAFFNADGLIANQVATLGGNQAIAGLIFGGTAAAPIAIAGDALTLGSEGVQIQVGSGAHTINSALNFASGALANSWTNNSGNLFSVAGATSMTGQTVTFAGSGSFPLFALGAVNTVNGAGGEISTFNNLTNQQITVAGPVSLGGGLRLQGTAPIVVQGSVTVQGSGRTIFMDSDGHQFLGNIAPDTAPRTLTLNSAPGATGTFNGLLQNNGANALSIIKANAGTVVFNGANSFSGLLTINEGIVRVNTSNATNNPALTFGGTGTAGTLDLGDGVVYRMGAITVNAGSGGGVISGANADIALNAARTFTVGDTPAANDLVIDARIRNQEGGGGTAQNLTKTGEGTLVLNGANDFTGTFTHNQGTVVQNASQTAAGALTMGGVAGATPTLTAGPGAVFRLGGNLTVSSTSNGAVINGDATGGLGLFGNRAFIIQNSPADVDLLVSVPIVDGSTAFGFRKEATGTMVMQGVNTYTGVTEVFRGSIVADFSVNNVANGRMAPGAELRMRGGQLVIEGNAAAPTSQTVGSLNLTQTATSTPPNNAGGSASSIVVNANGGQAVTLNLGAITRPVGQGLVDLAVNDANLVSITTTTGNNSGGFIGGHVTFNGRRWAASGSTKIEAFAGTVQDDAALWQAGQHIIVDGALSGVPAVNRVGSLILNGPAANTLTLSQPGGVLSVTNGAILAGRDVGTNPAEIAGGQVMIDSNNPGGGGTELTIVNQSSAPLVVGASIGSTKGPLVFNQTVTVGGSEVVELAGRNFTASGINIGGSAPTYTIAGPVRVRDGQAIPNYATVSIGTGFASLDLNGTSEAIGALQGGSFSNQGGSVTLGTGGTLTLHQLIASTYSGQFSGSGTVIKRGSATFTHNTNGSSVTGALEIRQGLFDLTGNNAGWTGISTVLIRGGQLRSEQNQGANVDKIANAASIRLEGTGGQGLRVTSNQNATRTETVGVLDLAGGHNFITIDNSAGTPTAALTVLSFGNATDAFVRSNRATMLVRGDALGAASGGRRTQITFSSGIVDELRGGILPFAVGSAADGDYANAAFGNSVQGDTFVTVGATGLRPLDVATEYNANFDAAGAAENVSLSSSTGPVAGKTINALRIDSSAGAVSLTGSGAGQVLNLGSGAILLSAAGGASGAEIGGFDGGIQAGTTDEYVVFVTQSAGDPALTISSPLNSAGASLTKAGNGRLILSGVNSYGGATTINSGELDFAGADSLGAGGLIRLANGTLRWAPGNATDITTQPDSSARTVELLGNDVYLTPAGMGGNALNSGARFDLGANDVTLANPVGASGYGGLTKVGSGTLTLSSAPTYVGSTRVAAGTMNFSTIAPSTTSALYLVGEDGATAPISVRVASGMNVKSLIVGGVYVGTQHQSGSLTVNGGAVTIGDGGGDDFIAIGFRDRASGNAVGGSTTGVANFAAASSVNIDVETILVGQFNRPDGVGNATGTLTLSNGTNEVTSASIVVGDSDTPGMSGAASASVINLGNGSTAINTNVLVLGGQKADGTMNLGSGGSFALRGRDSEGANVFLGDNDAGNTGTDSDGLLNLAAGEVDLNINYLLLGRHSNGSGVGRGALSFSDGVVQARTIEMGISNFRGTSSDPLGTSGAIDMSGGVFRFEDMSRGSGSAVVNWSGGRVENIPGLDLRNENVNFNLSGGTADFSVQAGRTATFGASASFSGTGDLLKTGAGTLIVNGAGSHSGSTQVQQGTLIVNGSLGGAMVSVPSGVLGGDGTISTSVSIGASGILSPGASPGLLTINGGLSFDSGGKLRLEINGPVAGISFDRVALDGQLTLASGSILEGTSTGGFADGTLFFVVVNSSALPVLGTFQGVPQGGLVAFGAQEFLVSYIGDAGTSAFEAAGGNDLVLQAVPEPSSAMVVAMGMGFLAGLGRFRIRRTRG
jgi:autotransporter-associated beta strand protein